MKNMLHLIYKNLYITQKKDFVMIAKSFFKRMTNFLHVIVHSVVAENVIVKKYLSKGSSLAMYKSKRQVTLASKSDHDVGD